jgi:hypothetical protein
LLLQAKLQLRLFYFTTTTFCVLRAFPPQVEKSVFIRGIRGIRVAIMPLWSN